MKIHEPERFVLSDKTGITIEIGSELSITVTRGDKMKIDEYYKVIGFNSTPLNYQSEKREVREKGAKRNTIRFVQARENEQILAAQRTGAIKFIRICNTETGDTFLRKLTDFRQQGGCGIETGWFCWVWSW